MLRTLLFLSKRLIEVGEPLFCWLMISGSTQSSESAGIRMYFGDNSEVEFNRKMLTWLPVVAYCQSVVPVGRNDSEVMPYASP